VAATSVAEGRGLPWGNAGAAGREQRGQNAPGTGHIVLPSPGGHLAHARSLKGQRAFLSGGRQAARIQFLGHGQ